MDTDECGHRDELLLQILSRPVAALPLFPAVIYEVILKIYHALAAITPLSVQRRQARRIQTGTIKRTNHYARFNVIIRLWRVLFIDGFRQPQRINRSGKTKRPKKCLRLCVSLGMFLTGIGIFILNKFSIYEPWTGKSRNELNYTPVANKASITHNTLKPVLNTFHLLIFASFVEWGEEFKFHVQKPGCFLSLNDLFSICALTASLPFYKIFSRWIYVFIHFSKNMWNICNK